MYYIIGNPVAGNKRGYRAIKKLETFLKAENVPYDISVTDEIGHATELVTAICEKAIDEEIINIVAIGGDGTFNEIINGIIDFDKVHLGLIPAGRGNDFSRFSMLSKNPVNAFKDILKGLSRRVDLYEVGGSRLGLNVAGTGLDIEVLKKQERAKFFTGKFGYLIALISALFSFKPYKVRVTADDGEPTEHECILVACANGSCFGGGMKLSPNSNVFDGKVNLVYAHMVKKWKLAWLLPSFLNGSYLKKSFGEEHFVRSAKIELISPQEEENVKNAESRRELFVNVDGQILKDTSFDIKVLPAKLNLYCSEKFVSQTGVMDSENYLNQ